MRGIHRSPVNSPHKGQWRGALMFSLICARKHGWVNNGEAGDLRRYRVHYDVIVMYWVDLSIDGRCRRKQSGSGDRQINKKVGGAVGYRHFFLWIPWINQAPVSLTRCQLNFIFDESMFMSSVLSVRSQRNMIQAPLHFSITLPRFFAPNKSLIVTSHP